MVSLLSPHHTHPLARPHPKFLSSSTDIYICAVEMTANDVEEDEAQRLINEEYKTWKKNAPFLYDMILR